MNDLSWFLYFVDISSGIQAFFTTASAASVVGIIGFVITGCFFLDTDYRGYMDREERNKIGKKFHKAAALMLIPVTFFFILAVLIPSKETLYLIGASQVGEKVIALKEVQQLGGDVGDLAKDTIKLLREKINASTDAK